MKIIHFAPENPLLKPFIAGIYLLERFDGEPPESYLAFPGIHQFITINREVVCHATDYKVGFSHQLARSPLSMLITNFGVPRLWSYEGPIQEWNICFKPLGLHYFLDADLIDFSCKYLKVEFEPFTDYAGHVEALYKLSCQTAQIRLLEDYWASKLNDFSHPFLQELINEILGNNEGQRLNFSELAQRFKVSRNTLHIAFKRYVGTTPARFEKVHRFRNALAAYRLAGQFTTLTHISGEAAYFDQSHMIRDFKSFTGFTPKEFYKKISPIPKGDINWAFV